LLHVNIFLAASQAACQSAYATALVLQNSFVSQCCVVPQFESNTGATLNVFVKLDGAIFVATNHHAISCIS
jgi:hypothetical protein